MDRLLCPCLNVSVSCSRSYGGWRSRPTAALRLFPEGSKDRLVFKGSQLYEVELDVDGVFAVSVCVCVREREKERESEREREREREKEREREGGVEEEREKWNILKQCPHARGQ